jgi:four helix bundle protein
MFLQLNHKKLGVYESSRQLTKHCYQLTKELPADEKYNLIQQIRRAALSVKLNIAEGSSRKSENERKRYYEIARESVVEIDAAVETIFDTGLLPLEKLTILQEPINKVFAQLSNMIK